ncbi:EamA domain - like 10 [Theobroma cacao]|nr:EamA domain - like 10 [Theobroma cacao]
MERKTSAWQIGWDMNLLAAAYAGIVTSSISYYVQGMVIKKRGPVFATAFSPLMMIIVAIMGSFILAEKIFLGGVIGAIWIVIGLYSVLWGKHKENKEKEVNEEEIPEPVKIQANGNTILVIEDIEANEVELKKLAEANKLSAVAIAMPMPESPMKANQDQTSFKV